MILQLLTGIHNLTTLLFGIFISAFFLGVKPIMKKFRKTAFVCIGGCFFLLGHQPLYRHGVCQSALPCFGTPSAHFIFVFVLPLFTFILLYFCFSAYLCCQFSNWIGLSALTLTKNPVWYYSSRIAMTFITFFFLFKFVRRTTQTIFFKGK